MNRQKTLISIGLVLLSVGCNVLTPTPTPLPPTPTPIPPTPTLPPDVRIFKLVSEGEKITPADGSPYFIAAFTSDGKTPPGLFADFRNTKFDISSVDERLKNEVGVAVQMSPDNRFEHTVLVDGTNLEFFYIDNDYIVFPQNVSAIKENGPFVRFVFHSQGGDGKSEPLGDWGISVEQEGRKVSEKLSAGAVDLANVTLAPIHFSLTDPSTSKTYEYVAFPAVRGAVERLVVYMVWDVTNP
jgi:hypothetical protein